MPLSNPTTQELITAIQQFLTDTVTPQVYKHTAFHLKVACNMLGIVSRDLGQGAELDALAREQLAKLLPYTRGSLDELNRTLCEKIRDKTIAHDDPALLEVLQAISEAKLAIDNPKYRPASPN